MIPETRKNMIRSLVYQYTDRKTRPWSADHIQNKGDGQIFLLHGSPGVGKTFTAECIAELTGKPLLALTCADIGTDEVEMEEKLGKWLNLGHKWGAIMLIDEADVLMEKRQHADLKRNSLVSGGLDRVIFLTCSLTTPVALWGLSLLTEHAWGFLAVFLREIEYYRGILFLTTNSKSWENAKGRDRWRSRHEARDNCVLLTRNHPSHRSGPV